MAKKVFTDESLETFVDEIKSYTDDSVSAKANTEHSHTVDDITDFQTSVSGQIAPIISDVDILKAQIADILYEPISITSFSHNKGTVERGVTVTDVTLSWNINKTPTALTLDGTTIDTSLTGKAITGLSITWDATKTWTLKATDDREATSTKTTSVTFANGVYYGVGTVTTFDSAFIGGLTKRLQTARAYDFTVNPSAQYIYYCHPTRLGTSTFKVGGFEGGFEAPQTISFTNSSGYTENYYVYRSTNMITGSTTVDVS